MHWFADDGQRRAVWCSSTLGKEKWGGPHDETVDAKFEYSDGLTVCIATSVIHEPSSLIKITGNGGMAVCESTLSRFNNGTILVNGAPLGFDDTPPFRAQIADFVTAIR